MADSSPGLQSQLSNYLGDMGPKSQEGSSLSDLAVQNETSARMASEVLAGQKQPSGGADGIKRAANVLAGGLADGFIDSAENSLNLKTAVTVVESAAFGYGMGALAKAGPVGQKIAMAGGLLMGGKWVYDEMQRGRPQATINAVADAYNSGANLAQDRKTVATNGGALAFETTLAFGAGAMGMAGGASLKTNWHLDAAADLSSTYGKAVDFLARDGRVNGAHVLHDGDMGLAFAGKDSGAPTVMSQAKEIISGKTKGSGSLNDIQESFRRSQAIQNDAHLLDTRAELVKLEAQHVQVRTEENILAPKLAKAVKDKAAAGSLDGLDNAVRVRDQALKDAIKASHDLPDKNKELQALFQEKQAAFERQKPKPGVEVDQALRDDFQAKHKNFQEQKAKYDELKVQGSAESIATHRQELAAAQQALATARAEQPGKLAQAQADIDALNLQVEALKTRRAEIEGKVKPLIDAYGDRLALIMKDPSQLVQAQFEPPAAKVAPTKAVEPAHSLPKVDMQPVVTEAIVISDTTSGAGAHAPAKAEGVTIGPEQPATTNHVEADHTAATADHTAVQADRPALTEPEITAQAAKPTAHSEVKGLNDGPSKAAEKVEGQNLSPVERLSRDAQASRETALKAVQSNELVREKEYVTKVLSDIDRGTYRPNRGASVPEVKLEMERRLAEANEKLKTDPAIKYTRAIKAVRDYSRSIGRQLAETPDAGARDVVTEQALKDIEGMMNRLPTSYKGYTGRMPDLAEPSRAGRVGSPEKRFAEVAEHLENKVANLDNSRAKQITDRAETQPVLNEIMTRLRNSELPKDGSIILIGKDGKYLGPVGGTSPYFIEVARMEAHGFGADGGGFNRLESLHDQIAGAVVLRPIYDAAGKPVELRINNGKPVFKKIVAETFGTVPEGIVPDLNFVNVLRGYAPAR